MAVSERERKMLIFGLGGLALFIFGWFVLPAFFGDKTATTTQSVGKEKQDLAAIMHLYKDFANVRKEYQKIENRINTQKSFSILTELENLASKSEIRANIESMESKAKPKNEFFDEEAVDIRLTKVTLKQLVSFMYYIDYSTKVLRVKKVNLEVRFDNKDLFNAHLEVSAYKPLAS